MGSLQIIVIDDELAIRQVLSSNLGKEGYSVENFGDAESAFTRLSKGDVDIAVCDIRMPGESGIELMDKVLKAGIDTSFLLMTAHASIDTAIEAMRLGAFDYMIKPVHTEEVLHQIKQICDLRGLRTENKLLRSLVLGDSENECGLDSEPIREVQRMVEKVASTESTVLITGESGTGKGVFARRIHRMSGRVNGPFIPVNCGSIAENLMESEFFGHLKGAFTGAERAKKGLFLEADKGTIFLDEIGELPLHLQVKFLHVLESKEVRAVGSERSRKVDVRIVTATNRDLGEMVTRGEFREDLYFRLNVFHMHIPPLRERQGDIINLAHFFVRRDADKFAHGKQLRIEMDAESALLNYAWPGNVREVENVIARALILTDTEAITINELPSHISNILSGYEAEDALKTGLSLKDQVKIFECNLIKRTIDEMDGDRSAAAKKLGIGTSTLYRKLDEYE